MAEVQATTTVAGTQAVHKVQVDIKPGSDTRTQLTALRSAVEKLHQDVNAHISAQIGASTEDDQEDIAADEDVDDEDEPATASASTKRGAAEGALDGTPKKPKVN